MVRTNVQETAENGGTYQQKNQTTHPQMTFFLSAWCDLFFRKNMPYRADEKFPSTFNVSFDGVSSGRLAHLI